MHAGIIPYDAIYSGFAERLTALNEQNMDKLPTFAHYAHQKCRRKFPRLWTLKYETKK